MTPDRREHSSRARGECASAQALPSRRVRRELRSVLGIEATSPPYPRLRGQRLLASRSRPILEDVLAHLQEWRSILVRVALTIAIVVGLWAISDPIGYLFAVILVVVVWFWGKELKPETSASE